MNLGKILIWHLGAAIVFVLAMLLSQQIWPEVLDHRSFSINTAIVFVVLSFIIVLSSSKLVDHKNPYYFSWITMMSVLIKLAIGVGMVVYYTKTASPPNKLYIVPFILAYAIFTICEVYLLQCIIQSSKKTWKK